MGVLLKWKRPTTEATYNLVKVYRSGSESGTYTEVTSQTIADTSYFDYDGSGTSWYKIRFYDSVNDVYSNYSSALQGSTEIGYCSVDDVRTMTNVKSSQVSDTELAVLIEMASANLNADINVIVEDEKIGYLDVSRQNKIDGTNDTYYLQNFPLGDSNNSYSISIADVSFYSVNSDGDKTSLTISTVTASTGKIVLETTPEEVDLYVSYQFCNISVDPPHRLVKMAAIWLAAAYAYSKINLGKAPRFKQGSLTVFRDTYKGETAAHIQYMKRYYDELLRINEMVQSVQHEKKTGAWV